MGNSKNFGQVVGMYVGTSAPDNQLLIWYDSTPSQKYHKIYDPSTSSWVALNPEVVTNITYSEIKSSATRNGLPVGKMYKLTDKSNVLAISLTSTKIQYVDTAGNYIVDDLASSKIYYISSDNLTIDGLKGVFSESTGKLNFPFADKTPDFNLDYFFGKVKVGTDWMLAKFSFTKLISQFTGNSLSWKNGLFFNFSEAINSIKDKDGGIVSKSAFNTAISNLQSNLNNVGKENQKIAEIAQTRLNDATTADQIYGKQLPSAPTAATATDIVRGDTLSTIINKVQRYINRFKYATGIYLSASYATAANAGEVNNNDSVQSAISKIMYYIKNPLTEIKLDSNWVPKYGTTETTGDPDEIKNLKGHGITDVFDKFATWLLSTLYTTKLPTDFEGKNPDPADPVRSSDNWKGLNLLQVFQAIADWLDNGGSSIRLSDIYEEQVYIGESPYPQANDTLDTAIGNLAAKFRQLGVITPNKLSSKSMYGENPAVEFNLSSSLLILRNSQATTDTRYRFTQYKPDEILLGTNTDSTHVSIKPNGSIFRHNDTVYISESGKYAGLGIVSQGTGNSTDVALTAVCTGRAIADAYFPRIMSGMQILQTMFVSGSDYTVAPSSGTFVVFSDTTERNIWLPANPANGTIVYVTRCSNKGCNVWCTTASNNGIDKQGSSTQYLSIGDRGRIYFFIFVEGISYSSESRSGLWQFGYMNQ